MTTILRTLSIALLACVATTAQAQTPVQDAHTPQEERVWVLVSYSSAGFVSPHLQTRGACARFIDDQPRMSQVFFCMNVDTGERITPD